MNHAIDNAMPILCHQFKRIIAFSTRRSPCSLRRVRHGS